MHNEVTFFVQALTVMHKKVGFCVHVFMNVHTKWQKSVFVLISGSHAPTWERKKQAQGRMPEASNEYA